MNDIYDLFELTNSDKQNWTENSFLDIDPYDENEICKIYLIINWHDRSAFIDCVSEQEPIFDLENHDLLSKIELPMDVDAGKFENFYIDNLLHTIWLFSQDCSMNNGKIERLLAPINDINEELENICLKVPRHNNIVVANFISAFDDDEEFNCIFNKLNIDFKNINLKNIENVKIIREKLNKEKLFVIGTDKEIQKEMINEQNRILG